MGKALRRPQVLILTATITPPADARNLARLDPRQRMDDYLQALSFYIQQLKDGVLDQIVFAENSDTSVDELRDLCTQQGVQDRVEFVSFMGLDYPPSYGRGYGEFKLLDHAMQHARFVRQAAPDTLFWKVTGRYRLLNLARIAASTPANVDFYCHCRNHPMRWVDLYVLAWTALGYQEVVRGLYPQLREDTDHISAEVTFRKRLDHSSFQSKLVRRFKWPPELEGVRGLDNQSYQEMNLKLQLRRIANVLLPWVWI